MMGLGAIILVFWVLSFKPAFPLSSFTLTKRLFSPSLLSVIRLVSSTHLRLMIFLPTIFIPACDSSSPAFGMMYSAYELNKQGNNIQPCHTFFPILNQSIVPYLVLTVASCPAYRFLRRQTCKVVWYSHFFKNFSQFAVTHTVKGFSVVNEAKVDDFLEFLCFLYDPTNVGNLISGSSAFSKLSLYIWEFSIHILLKSRLKDFEHNLTSMQNEHNCMIVWTFFGIALLWD